MKELLLKLKEYIKEIILNKDEEKRENQELTGNIIRNKVSKINLSENYDFNRLRYDYGIRLKNDSIVKVKSNQLIINEEGLLYFLDEQNNEELEVGKIEDYLYEFDIFKQEWKKADIISILVNLDFSVKRLKEADKMIIENRNINFYSNICNNNFEIKGVEVYER
ncbi:hypothetical protein [uncultured Clostridium sp.]|uniref:hypothetical protein n=1 Tax=uncultured Clostridium sp. TaxID=59620 RepID=UPI00272C2A4B|nr:hypothetical protein [uncultured Clostridium sp.]